MKRSNKLILLPSILALFAVLTIASSASAQIIGAGPSGGTRAIITAPPTEGRTSVGSLWLQVLTLRYASLGLWLGTQFRTTSIDPMSPAPLGQRSFTFVSQLRMKAGRR